MITVSIEHALASGFVTTGQLVASGEIVEASSPILRTEPAGADDLKLAALVQARRLARFPTAGKPEVNFRFATPTPLPATLPLGLSLKLAAHLVGVSPNTCRKLERDGLMPARKLIGGRRLYDRDDLLLAFKRLPTIDGKPGTPPPALTDPAEDHTWDDFR
jgi:hypothetical protein